MLYNSPLPPNMSLHEVTIHIGSLLIFLPLGVLFLFPVMILWCVHIKNSFTNRTTNERFGKGKKKKMRVESESDLSGAISTTTSLLAEKLVENIGGPKEPAGSFKCCKNLNMFCLESCVADCKRSGEDVGYQEKIIKELYENQRERHGYEEDWGLVVTNLNNEITEESHQNSEEPFLPRKIRARTLAERFGST